jgi:hypothetical protein
VSEGARPNPALRLSSLSLGGEINRRALVTNINSSSNEHSPIPMTRFLITWVLVNALLLPFAFLLALLVTFFLGFLGHSGPASVAESQGISIWVLSGSLLFGGTAGVVIGLAQWVAIRTLKLVRFWIPVTIAGFMLGMVLSDIVGIHRASISVPHWLISLSLTWVLPSLLVALFQTIVFFVGGLRAYLWPILGTLSILITATGYSLGGLYPHPAALLGATISAIALWVALRRYQLQHTSIDHKETRGPAN